MINGHNTFVIGGDAGHARSTFGGLCSSCDIRLYSVDLDWGEVLILDDLFSCVNAKSKPNTIVIGPNYIFQI